MHNVGPSFISGITVHVRADSRADFSQARAGYTRGMFDPDDPELDEQDEATPRPRHQPVYFRLLTEDDVAGLL